MDFKLWPYWVRGGIISLLVYFFLYVVLGICLFSIKRETVFDLLKCNSLITSLSFPISLFKSFIPNFEYVSPNTKFIATTLSWYLIGAVLGWLYGKIKKDPDQK